eukprot:3193836-Pyramimonas_sp.AAC.1
MPTTARMHSTPQRSIDSYVVTFSGSVFGDLVESSIGFRHADPRARRVAGPLRQLPADGRAGHPAVYPAPHDAQPRVLKT